MKGPQHAQGTLAQRQPLRFVKYQAFTRHVNDPRLRRQINPFRGTAA
jgi:hypothetical protein